jgi:signal transduction histidine kinase/CheY-like chemotaxis protein
MGSSEPASELRAIAEWRAAILERVLWVCLLLLSVAVLLSFQRSFFFQGKLLMTTILPSWALVASATLWPKAPLRFREITLVAGLLTLTVGGVAKLGFQAINAYTAHLMLVVMVSLFMGQRAAWLVWALGLLGWAGVAFLTVHGAPAVSDALFDPGEIRNWRRILGIYALLSGITLYVVSYLAARMEKALRRSEALYAALTQESTERIAALEEQRALEAQLRQSQKLEALGTLAGGVAHDFNNLLVVIFNHADFALEQASSESVRDSLKQIQTASDRAASLTSQLLAFGRRQVTQRSALDINARVDESLRMLRRLLPATITLEPRLEANPPRVWAAAVELDQIIMNLCVNARDAMPDGGTLQIHTHNVQRSVPGTDLPQDFVCIEIRDSGMGMDEATRRRIFEPFFTTKSPGQGTGLGLSTVHGLVQQASGFIEVDSALGHGTSLSIYLPSHQGHSAEASGATPLRVRRGHETLLVADDDPGVLEVLKRRLGANGYHVIACRDGEEALREFRQHASEIALVLSDAVMPKLGGRDLHRAICAEFGEVPFLICSGYAAQTIEPEFFEHPLRGFLSKPFNEQSLQSAVRALLDVAQGESAGRESELIAGARGQPRHA